MTPEEEAANQIPEGGVQEPAANQIPEGGAQETVKEDAPGDAEPKTVSVEAVMAETRKRQEAEARLATEQAARQAAEQNAEYMRQQAMVQQTPEPVIADDEYLTAGQVRQMNAQQNQQMQYNMFLNQHPDTAEVVGQSENGVFKPSEHLQKASQANPFLYSLQAAAIAGNWAALQDLYFHATAQKQLSETQSELETLRQAAAANNEQQASIAAKTGVTSPLSAGGGGAVTGTLPEPGTPEGDAYFERMKAGEFD